MKLYKIILLALVSASVLVFTGCDDDFDNMPPSPPTNVITVTGDNWIEVQWDYNREGDIAGYNVYFNYTYDGEYTLIGSTTNNYFVDYDAVNGARYFYAVTAFNYDGYESELSHDYIHDTPRPEGFNRAVMDFNTSPSKAGYDFSDYMVVAYNDDYSDFFFENSNGTYYLNVWENTQIQDMGETYDIYNVSEAPLSGWVEMYDGDNVKYTEAILEHTYVIWTWDDHYAKVRIRAIDGNTMIFDWAYQTVKGEVQLKRKHTSARKEGEAIELRINSR